ncbi:MAG TPA: PhzF family phenazine biosynthesis protein [Actinocrinis sp.]|nr:PhzF family phenazine biosynthesis protein [Actinocrinis sp.]HEV3170549.1 PhzF family phenazine biosynthesis protein [Actinocrinis sp.]
MTTLDVRVVRVFADAYGAFGNPLGVVFDAAHLPSEVGTQLTAQLGFSETVFVDDLAARTIRIFTPVRELRLAGHPVVGTAWVLARELGRPPEVLRPRLADEVAVWERDSLTWARCSVADAQQWDLVRLESPAAVEALPVPPGPGIELTSSGRGSTNRPGWCEPATSPPRSGCRRTRRPAQRPYTWRSFTDGRSPSVRGAAR